MLMCNFLLCGICLSAFSHDAARILASPELIAGAARTCPGELGKNQSCKLPLQKTSLIFCRPDYVTTYILISSPGLETQMTYPDCQPVQKIAKKWFWF